MSKSEQNIELLYSIMKKYSRYPEDYEEIRENCAKKLFSKSQNGTTYGMFFPFSEMKEYFIYRGKIVGERAKYDNEYCFDEGGRLLATKFVYYDVKSYEYVFYFYGESYVDYVRINSRYEVKGCGRYETENGKLLRLIECRCVFESGKISEIAEYVFGIKRGCVIFNKYYTGISGMQDVVQTNVFSRLFGA